MSCELDLSTGQFYDTDTNLPCNPSDTSGTAGDFPTGSGVYLNPNGTIPSNVPIPQQIYTPSATVNQGGIAINTTPLDKILSSVLSGFALLTRAPYVPTTVQPVKNTTPINYAAGGINPQTGLQLSGSQAVGTTTQGIFNWVKANPVPLAGIGIAYFLFTRDPKRR